LNSPHFVMLRNVSRFTMRMHLNFGLLEDIFVFKCSCTIRFCQFLANPSYFLEGGN
jgi:hypothetical protein